MREMRKRGESGALLIRPRWPVGTGLSSMSAQAGGTPWSSGGLREIFGLLGTSRSSLLAGIVLLTTGASAVVAQDAKRGEHVFRKCLLCHVVEAGSTSSIAPPLQDVVGRLAGSIKGFQYSEIMQLAREKGLTWSEDALFQFLDKPEDFMPGTYMAFAGLEERERRDVIAYLKQLAERGRTKSEGGITNPAPQTPAVAAQPQAPAAKTDPAWPTTYVPNVPPAMLQPKATTPARRPERQTERVKRSAQQPLEPN